jgi:hypothetical protein
MMTKLYIVDYINLYIIFRVKNINFTQKYNTGAHYKKRASTLHEFNSYPC